MAADNVTPRLAGALFALSALGEMAVGIAVLVVPEIAPLLIAAPLDAGGLLVARMLGGALLALGITWWLVRGDPAAMRRSAPGFLLYNVGVGILFIVAASSTMRPALPALLGAAHILLGAAFAGTLLAGGRSTG